MRYREAPFLFWYGSYLFWYWLILLYSYLLCLRPFQPDRRSSFISTIVKFLLWRICEELKIANNCRKMQVGHAMHGVFLLSCMPLYSIPMIKNYIYDCLNMLLVNFTRRPRHPGQDTISIDQLLLWLDNDPSNKLKSEKWKHQFRPLYRDGRASKVPSRLLACAGAGTNSFMTSRGISHGAFGLQSYGLLGILLIFQQMYS